MARKTETPARNSNRSTDTRAALIEAGLRTFSVHGYAGSRLADIAGEAGLTTGAFYRHFSSKQDFYAALFDEYGEVLQERLNTSPDLLSQLESWVVVSREHRGVIRATAEIADPGAEAAEAQKVLRDACGTLFARNLQNMPSWRLTHGAAVMLVDIMGQITSMEVVGRLPERDPTAIAAALDRLVRRGLYAS